MANMNGFNANEVDPDVGFDPLPAGKYKVAIAASQMKPTKNKNGSYLELEFTVLEGDYKDRKVWARLNLSNPSEKAVQIARAQLSAICRAVGVMTPTDSVELHNIPLVITVKCKKDSQTEKITNDVKKFEAVGQQGLATTSHTPAPGDQVPWG